MVFPNTIWGIIETGKCTIEDFSGTECMVFNSNEWYFQIPFGVSLRLASVPLRTSVVPVLNGIQL